MIDQIIVFALCSLFIYFFIYNGNKRLPPGPFRLPVLGSFIQIYRANPKYPHIGFKQLSDKYGDVMSFGYGTETAVIVSSYEAMKDLFKLHDTSASRFEFAFVPDRNYKKNLGIIFGKGQQWAEVRSFTKKVLREFGYGKIKIMDQSLADTANQLVDCIKMELLDSVDGTYAVETKKFSFHILNVVWKMVGGYTFDPNDQLLLRNMKCVDKANEVYGNANPYNVFPFLKDWFPKQMHYDEHLKIHEEIHGFTKFLVNDAQEKRSQRIETEPTSFIEVFLDKIDDSLGDPDTIFTHEQLEVILEDLFLGALETTATLLNWSILFMVLNPGIQAKVRQEITGKMTNHSRSLPAIELKRLPYLKATILEIFRMGDIAPMPAPRSTTKDVEYRDYIIPKGSILFYNLYALYNDENLWKDPEVFRPERFLNEIGEIDQSRSEKILNTVFGFGPRVCFGESIALDSFFVFLATMIVNFKFDPIPGKEPSVDDPHFELVVRPQKYSVTATEISI